MTIPDLSTAEAGSRELDAAVAVAFGLTKLHVDRLLERDLVPPVSTSIDAAVALVERVLPGWGIQIKTKPERGAGFLCEAWISRSHPKNGVYSGAAPTAPLAILRALQAAVEGK